MNRTRLLIGGEWIDSGSEGEFASYDPATGRQIGVCPEAGQSEVDAAVDAARQALDNPEWRDMTPAARGRLLWRIADLVEADLEELGKLETLDQGQPIGVGTYVSAAGTAEHFRYFAGWATKIEGATTPVSIPGVFHYTRREPVGVCGLITPWNFPMLIAAWKLAPALACGNTVVLKPAEQTPLTTYRLVELCQEAGLPAGVLNFVTGGPKVGQAMTGHDRIDKISFTGSTEVGKEIIRASAGNAKRLTLELGGKAPSIIAADADIDAAVAGNLNGAMFNSGQVCAAYSRFYVDEKRADEFAEKLAVGVKQLRVGPGSDPETVLGPLVSEEQVDRVDGLVKTAAAEGAEVRSGGVRPAGDLADGYFFEPTVLSGVTDEMQIARQEIFGPVIPILTYSDPEELSARANDTEYGLAAAVWTDDLKTAHRLAAQIDAGSVYINMPPVPDPAAPWGGFKSSGYGQEMGPYAIDSYTKIKGVFVNLA